MDAGHSGRDLVVVGGLQVTDTSIQTMAPAPMGAMSMIQTAFEKAIADGGPQALEVAREILKQMESQRDYESRDRFNQSLLRIQEALKPIVKRGHGEKPGARYALIEDIDAALNPLLAREGMNLSFEPGISEKPNVVVVTAVLAQGAYERRYPLEMPADGAGPKGGQVMTRTHATGSAMTYAKRYLKNFIFDIQFRQPDDDGNRAGGGKQPGRMSEQMQVGHVENIRQSATLAELERLYLHALGEAESIGDTQAISAIIKAKSARVAELKGRLK